MQRRHIARFIRNWNERGDHLANHTADHARVQRTPPLWRLQMLERMTEYAGRELARGERLSSITRHMLGLYSGLPGAKEFRRRISEGARDAQATPASQSTSNQGVQLTASSLRFAMLRFSFRQQLTPNVSAPSEAWRFFQGVSPCQVRSSQPPVPRVASGEEVEDSERIR